MNSIPPLPIDLSKAIPYHERLSFHDIGFSVRLLFMLWEAPDNSLVMTAEEIVELYGRKEADKHGWRAFNAVQESFWWSARNERLWSPYILELIGKPQKRTSIPRWMKAEVLAVSAMAPGDPNAEHSVEYDCHYCGVFLDDDYHFDHALPLSRGGINHPQNLRLACPECNLQKRTQTEEEFGVYDSMAEFAAKWRSLDA